MRRVVSLFLPRWPTDRWRRNLGADAPGPETPVITVGRVGAHRRLLDADAAARALGAHPGMAVAQVQARTPGLHVVEADPQADALALERLAVWVLRRYSPLVAVDGGDGLWIDATGGAHRFGGDAGLLKDIRSKLASVGVEARVGAAAAAGAAHALARYGPNACMVAGPDSEALVRALPIAALRLEADMMADLVRLGFGTIDDLERTARAPLALRFGSTLTRRLDQALGRQAETFEPLAVPESPHVRHAFLEPISAPETLARRIGKLVGALCDILDGRGLGARTLDLICERVDGRRESARIGTAKPNRDPQRLSRLLCDRLDRIDPGFGIEAMSLCAPLVEALAPRASPFCFGAERTPPDVEGLIDVLANRLGVSKVYRLAPVESDVPERSVRRVAPATPPGGRSWVTAWPRPSRLLSPPEPVEAVAALPDQPPAAFTWKGQRRRVKRADGPERIYGEWWEAGRGAAQRARLFRR